MLVLVPSASHIWVKMIPGGRVHCHWKEPSLPTVQERLAADTTLSGPGGTSGSNEGGCRNVIGDMGRGAETRYRTQSQSLLQGFSRLRATWCHYTYTLLSFFLSFFSLLVNIHTNTHSYIKKTTKNVRSWKRLTALIETFTH